MNNGMNNGWIKKGLLILLALPVAALALFAATDAGAACLQAATDGGGCEKFETASGWTIEIIRGTGDYEGQFPVICDGTDDNANGPCADKRGPIVGRMFAYEIGTPQDGLSHSVSQANISVQNCGEGNEIAKLYPNDNAIKILSHDPTSKYSMGDPDDLVTWDALKLDSNDHATIAVYTSLAGAGPGGGVLKVDDGYEYIEGILGPVCCEQTQVATQISVDHSTVNFDSCTGDLTAVTGLTPVEGDLWACWSSTGTFDNKTECNTVKKMGPASGSFIDVVALGQPVNDPYSGIRYYGYGNKIFWEYVENKPLPVVTPCVDPAPALVEGEITWDGKIATQYDDCGNVTDVSLVDGTPMAPTMIGLFESGKGSGPDFDTGGVAVNSGGRRGGILYTNPWVYYWGNYYWVP